MKLESINWGIIYSSGETLVGKETKVAGLNEIFFSKSSVVFIFHALLNLLFLQIIES